MYINEIFWSEEDFKNVIMKDFKIKESEIGFNKGDKDGFDDCIFIASEDDSLDATFFYFKGNSGRIIIVEEAIHHMKGE